jgi:hypothetical protein
MEQPIQTTRKYKIQRTTVGKYAVKFTAVSAHFGEMSWPKHGKFALTLDHRLRYAPVESITRSELLHAASIISAYRALIEKPKRERDSIVAVLRAVDDVPGGIEWHPSDGLGPDVFADEGAS